MAKRREQRGAGKNLPVLVNPRLMKGLEHVLRQHILLALVQGEASPKELAALLGERLSGVSYHVTVLRDECGLVEETGTAQRRGAIEHFYKATAKTLLPGKAWRGLKKGLRAAVGAGMANDLFDDLAGALKVGKLQGPNDLVSRVPLVLDEEGRRNVHAIARRAGEDAEREQKEASARIADRDGDAKTGAYTFGVFAFEPAWNATDLHALEAGAEGAGPASAKRKAAAE